MVDGVRVVVPDSLELITPYVLREQGDWFEDEIRFVRRAVEPGATALDIGCTLVGAVPGQPDANAEGDDADELSEQILAALVDEYGREQADGSVRAWLRKRRSGTST